MKRISADELKQSLDGDGTVLLINVLPEESYREKHIPGSVNIPVGVDSFLQRVEHAAKDEHDQIVVYCADAACNASPKAARVLEEAGFERVADFEGGVAEWEERGFPLEGEAVQT